MADISPDRDDEIHAEAALWYARLAAETVSRQTLAQFDAWLSAAPAHQEAYAEACALAGRFDALAGAPETAALRAQTAALGGGSGGSSWLRLGLAASVACLAVASAFVVLRETGVETASWSTAPGERREIVLSDGTRASIGSGTQIDIAFSAERRDLHIVTGQVFLDVAHDPARPLVAEAAGRTVTALGTRFDVRTYPDETIVTLVEGKVAIADDSAPGPLVLAPGQQFLLKDDAATVRAVNADAETAWRDGLLDLNEVALLDAVISFNRNAARQIVIADPQIAGFSVSGVFRIDQPEAFAAALEPAYPIDVTFRPSGDIVLRHRP